jgi:uncharacterized protein YcnI
VSERVSRRLALFHHRALRAAVVAMGCAAVMVLGAGVASAHVTAHPGEAAKTSLSKIAFRVPNESPTAGTVKLEIDFPADHPIAIASAKPHPGWTHAVTKKKLDPPVTNTGNDDIPSFDTAITSITWTAQPGTRVAPGEFDEFEVVVGPLPQNTDVFVTPAIQTYDDGHVVSWEQPWPTGRPEPEHPAPKVTLTSGDPALNVSQVSYHLDPANRDAVVPELGGTRRNAGPAGTNTVAAWLSGAAVAIGLLGVGVGIGATRRARRRDAT